MGKIKWSFLLIFFLAFGCSDHHTVWNSSIEIPGQAWSWDDSLEAIWLTQKELTKGAYLMDVLHNESYRYQNIYLIGRIDDSESTIWQDTFSIQLAAANSGRWLGFKQKGNLLSVTDTVTVLKNIPENEKIRFQIRPYGRDSILNGIVRLDLRVVDQ